MWYGVRPALFSTRLVALPLPFPLESLTVGFSVGRASSVGVCQPFSPSLLFALVCELTSYHFRWIDGNSVTLRSAAPASPLEQLSRSVGTRVHSVYDRLPRDFDHIGLSPSFSSSPPFFFPLGEQKATTTTTTHHHHHYHHRWRRRRRRRRCRYYRHHHHHCHRHRRPERRT